MISWLQAPESPYSAESVFDDADRLAVMALAWHVMNDQPEPVSELARHLRFNGEATCSADVALKHLQGVGLGVRLTTYRLLATLIHYFPADRHMTPRRMKEVQQGLRMADADATTAHLLIMQEKYALPFVPADLPAETAQVVLAVISALIYVDRSLHVHELGHLKATMEQLGLDSRDLAQIKQWQDLTATHMISSLELAYQPAVFLQAMLLVSCDGKVSAKEAETVMRMQQDLQLDDAILQSIIVTSQALLGESIVHFY